MAKVNYTNGIKNMSGKVGNMIYYNRLGQTCVREMPITVDNPQTVEQVAVRGQLINCLNQCRALPDVIRGVWQEWVGTLPEVPEEYVPNFNYFGFPYRNISAFNAYASVNIRMLQAGFGKVSIPPGHPMPAPAIFTVTWNEPELRYNVVIYWEALLQPEINAVVLIKGKGLWKGSPVRLVAVSDITETTASGALSVGLNIENWKIGHGFKIEDVSIATYLREERLMFQCMAVFVDGSRTTLSPMVEELVPAAP